MTTENSTLQETVKALNSLAFHDDITEQELKTGLKTVLTRIRV